MVNAFLTLAEIAEVLDVPPHLLNDMADALRFESELNGTEKHAWVHDVEKALKERSDRQRENEAWMMRMVNGPVEQ